MLAAAFQVAGAKGSLSRQPLSPVWWAAQVTQMSYNAFVSIKEAGLLLPSLLQSLSKFTGGVDLGSEWVTEEMYEQWCAEVRRRATHLECVPGAITRKVIHAPERPAAGWPTIRPAGNLGMNFKPPGRCLHKYVFLRKK